MKCGINVEVELTLPLVYNTIPDRLDLRQLSYEGFHLNWPSLLINISCTAGRARKEEEYPGGEIGDDEKKETQFV